MDIPLRGGRGFKPKSLREIFTLMMTWPYSIHVHICPWDFVTTTMHVLRRGYIFLFSTMCYDYVQHIFYNRIITIVLRIMINFFILFNFFIFFDVDPE